MRFVARKSLRIPESDAVIKELEWGVNFPQSLMSSKTCMAKSGPKKITINLSQQNEHELYLV